MNDIFKEHDINPDFSNDFFLVDTYREICGITDAGILFLKENRGICPAIPVKALSVGLRAFHPNGEIVRSVTNSENDPVELLRAISIPENIKRLHENCFWKFPNLEQVVCLGELQIKNRAFADCSKLKTFCLKKGIIGDSVFEGSGLEELILDQVMVIGKSLGTPVKDLVITAKTVFNSFSLADFSFPYEKLEDPGLVNIHAIVTSVGRREEVEKIMKQFGRGSNIRFFSVPYVVDFCVSVQEKYQSRFALQSERS